MAALTGSDDAAHIALEPPTVGEISIFLGAALAAFIGGIIMSRSSKSRRWLIVLVTFTPYLLPSQHINFLASHEVKGVSFSFRFIMTDIAMIALVGSLLFSGRIRKDNLLPPRFWAMGLLLMAAMLSMSTAIRSLFAAFEVLSLIRGIVILWVFYQCIQSEDDLFFFAKVMLSLLGYYVLNTAYYYIVHGVASPWGGATGFLRSKNGAAFRLILISPLALSYILVLKGHALFKKWLMALFLFAMVTLVLTDSRAGQGAFVVAFFFVIFMTWYYFRDIRDKYQKYALLAMLGLMGCIYFAPHVIKRLNLGVDDASTTWRRQAKELAYDAWQTNSRTVISGIGINNLSYWTRLQTGGRAQMAFTHNIYLLARAEMGLLGMAALMCALAMPIISGWQTVRETVSNKVDATALGFAAGIVGAATHGYFEPHLKGAEHQYLVWPSVAAIYACYTLAINRKKMRRIASAHAAQARLLGDRANRLQPV